MNVLLDIRNITVHYGKSVAIEDVSLQVTDGGLVSIIGAGGTLLGIKACSNQMVADSNRGDDTAAPPPANTTDQ